MPDALTPNDFDAAFDAMARTVDVKGAFSAASLRGLGVGDAVSDKQSEMQQELKKMNDKLRQES